jgi:hypothetical protein
LTIATLNGFRVDGAFLHDDALASSSDQPSVLFTAFRGGGDYTLHLLSLGAARSIEVTGVPDVDWRVRETIEEVQYQQRRAVRSQAHAVTLDLPSRSPGRRSL